MAEDIVVRITADDSGLISSMQGISEQAEGLQEVVGDVGGDIERSLAPVPDSITPIDRGFRDAGDSIDNAGKKVSKTGRNFGRFNRIAGRGVSGLGRFAGAGGRAASSIAGFGIALGGTPFGAFIILAGAATAAMSLFGKSAREEKEKIDKLSESLGGLNQEILGLEQQERRLEIELKTTNELDKQRLIRQDIIKEIKDRQQLQKELVEEQKNIGKELKAGGKTRAEIFELQEKAAQNEKEQVKNNVEILKLYKEQNDSFAKQKKIQDDTAKKNKEDAANRKKEQAEAQKILDGLIRNELKKRLAALRTEREARDERLKQIIKDEDKLADALERSKKFFGEDYANAINEAKEAQIRATNALYIELATTEREAAIKQAEETNRIRLQSIEANGKDVEELTIQSNRKLREELAKINKEFDEKDLQTDLEQKEKQIDIAFQSALAIQENDTELQRQTKVKQKVSEEEYKKFLEKEADKKTAIELNYQIAKLKLQNETNTKLTAEEKKANEERIRAFESQIAGLGVSIENAAPPKTLGDLLGIDRETQAKMKNYQAAVEQTAQVVSEALGEQVNALQKEVDVRNNRLSELQNNLSNEIRLAELGKASNIKELKEQIAEEERLRKQAVQDQKEAAQAKFIIDTALQASNLITAISSLYASLAGTVVGIAVATALSGVMIASFIGAKAAAASAAGFEEGGYTGNNGKSQISGVVHGQEYVVRAEDTKKYGLVGKSGADFGEAMSDYHSNIPSPRMINKRNNKVSQRINEQIRQHKEQIFLSYEKGIQNALTGQNTILKGILKATQNSPIVFPMGDDKYLIERGKNSKEIKRIKK